MSTNGEQLEHINIESREFEDESLPPVTSDNIDIELRMGQPNHFIRGMLPETNHEVIIPTDRTRRYHIVDAEVSITGDPNESNYIDAVVVADGVNIKPRLGEIVTLEVDNSLMEAREDSKELKRIFTGHIANASRYDEQTFEILAFWPTNNVIQDAEMELVPPVIEHLPDSQIKRYELRRRMISSVAREIGVRATEDTVFDYNINMSQDGVVVGETPSGEEQRAGRDKGIIIDSPSVPIVDILDRAARSSNSMWEIDRYGDFYFGAPEPTSHKLRYIADTDAAFLSPQWRSVKVIGSGVVSEDGWNASAQVPENAFVTGQNLTFQNMEGSLDNSVGTDVATAQEAGELDLAEPTFVYRNLQINTQTEAEDYLKRISEEIAKQAAGGEVTVVGHPEIWPGDAIEMPDAPKQPFSLERYGVDEVMHRINPSDGFITKVKTHGITNAESTVFASAFKASEEYEAEAQNDIERLNEGAQDILDGGGDTTYGRDVPSDGEESESTGPSRARRPTATEDRGGSPSGGVPTYLD